MLSRERLTSELHALAVRLANGENRDGSVNGAITELSERTGFGYLFLKSNVEARAGEIRQRRRDGGEVSA